MTLTTITTDGGHLRCSACRTQTAGSDTGGLCINCYLSQEPRLIGEIKRRLPGLAHERNGNRVIAALARTYVGQGGWEAIAAADDDTLRSWRNLGPTLIACLRRHLPEPAMTPVTAPANLPETVAAALAAYDEAVEEARVAKAAWEEASVRMLHAAQRLTEVQERAIWETRQQAARATDGPA